MQTYELTILVATSYSEAKRKSLLDKVKKLVSDAQGKLHKIEEWGKKTLAYPLKKNSEAFYYLLEFSVDTDRTNAINRVIENDDDVLRHLLVVQRTKDGEQSKEKEVDQESPEAKEKKTKKSKVSRKVTEKKKVVKATAAKKKVS